MFSYLPLLFRTAQYVTLSSVFWHANCDPRDLWPLRHLIRVMRKHDLTNILTIFENFEFFHIFQQFSTILTIFTIWGLFLLPSLTQAFRDILITYVALVRCLFGRCNIGLKTVLPKQNSILTNCHQWNCWSGGGTPMVMVIPMDLRRPDPPAMVIARQAMIAFQGWVATSSPYLGNKQIKPLGNNGQTLGNNNKTFEQQKSNLWATKSNLNNSQDS